jgi:hypothetical protein
MQHILVVVYGHFDTACRSHLPWSSSAGLLDPPQRWGKCQDGIVTASSLVFSVSSYIMSSDLV